MAHLSSEQLAALAADPSHALAPDDRAHLDACPSCRDELAGLDDLVRDVRAAGSTQVSPPSAAVWAGIERELAADEPVAPGPAGRADRSRRRRYAVVAVAAAVGLVVGVGGTLGVLTANRPTERSAPVASTVLSPLPGEAGQGTAELVRQDDALQLRVHVSFGAAPDRDYREVWLLNADGRRMYALGVLPSSGDASYWLPVPMDDRLDGYQTVDISLEPEDGDTAHSQHSLVRGRLPG